MYSSGAKVIIITDNPKLAIGLDDSPIVIPNNGPLTALIAVLPLQVSCITNIVAGCLSTYIHVSS